MANIFVVLSNDKSTYDHNKVICSMSDNYDSLFINETKFHLVSDEEAAVIVYIGNVQQENIDLFNSLIKE